MEATRSTPYKKHNVDVIPPENFRVYALHNSPLLDGCLFCAHIEYMTRTEIANRGFDVDLLDQVPTADYTDDRRTYRYTMAGEQYQPISTEESMDEYEIAECYFYWDIDGDGFDEYVKVTTAGGDVSAAVILDVEEVAPSNPFVSATGILMSHKLHGRSIYDRLKEVQEQKTSLWRNILDNMYLQNNQRTIVVEGQANLDDLLVTRPGGIIRAKTANAVIPMQTAPLTAEPYRMLEYLDTVRTGRAGVTPEGTTADSLVGSNAGSEGVDRVMTQREELVGLMTRVFAETALKPIIMKLHDLLRKDEAMAAFNLNGRWIDLCPAQWNKRKIASVRVGTGSGDKAKQSAVLNQVIAFQQALAESDRPMDSQMFNAVNDLLALNGLNGASRYFVDPMDGQRPEVRIAQLEQELRMVPVQMQEAIQQAVQQTEVEASIKYNEAQQRMAAMSEANASMRNQLGQAEVELKAIKQNSDIQINELKAELSIAKQGNDASIKQQEVNIKAQEVSQGFALKERELDIKEADVAIRASKA